MRPLKAEMRLLPAELVLAKMRPLKAEMRLLPADMLAAGQNEAAEGLDEAAAIRYVGCTLKKNYGTHVIKLDIAPKTYPLGQHLFISASNNMFYRHSQ
jgi:hypothetical protein